MNNNEINYCVQEHSEKLYNVMLGLAVSHYVNGQVQNNCYVSKGSLSNIFNESVQLHPTIMLPGSYLDDTYHIRKEGSTIFIMKTNQDDILDSVPCMILGYPTPTGVVDLIDEDYVDLNSSDPRIKLDDVEDFRDRYYKKYYDKLK